MEDSLATKTLHLCLPRERRIPARIACLIGCVTLSLTIYPSAIPLCHAQSEPKGKTQPVHSTLAPGLNRKEQAAKLVRKARQLASEWTKPTIAEAIKNYKKAQAIYEAGGETSDQLAVLLETGSIQEFADPAAALASYKLALNLSRRSQVKHAEATTLNRLGFLYIDRSGFPTALDYGKQAHELSLQMADRRNEGEALLLLGTSQYNIRQVAPAKDYLESSLKIFSELKDNNGEARALLMLGHVNIDLGNNSESLRLFNQSLDLSSRTNNLREKGKALNALAVTYSIAGEKQSAVAHYRQSIAIFRQIGDRRNEGITLNGMGYVYYTVAQNERSLNYYRRALKSFRSVGDLEGESLALARIGKNLEVLSGKKTAVHYYQELLTVTRRLKDPVFESYVLNWLGDVYASTETQRAVPYYTQALALSRLNSNPRIEAQTLNRLGYSYALLGDADSARRYYNSALERTRTITDREGESLTLYNLALLEKGQKRLGEAQALIERSLKIVESLTTDVGDRELRASYFATVHQQYEFYIDVLMQLHKQNPAAGFDSKALEVSERSRARSLLEMLGENRAAIKQGVDSHLLKQQKSAIEKLSTAIQKRQMIFSRPHSRQEVDNSQREISELTTEYEQIAAEIRQRNPRYAALTQPTSLTRAQIQDLLDGDTVMVEYALGERQSFAWAVTQDSIKSYELAERAKVERLARIAYEYLANDPDDKLQKPREDYIDAIARLSEILLPPIAEHAHKKRVVVIGEGALQYIPFSTLQVSHGDGDRRLLAQQEIVNLPSAAALAVQRRALEGREPATRSLAIVADPVFESDDSRIEKAGSRNSSGTSRGVTDRKALADVSNAARALRDVGINRGLDRLLFSRREADEVFKLIPQGDGMKALDFQASRKTVVSDEFSNYRMLHFATHGVLDNQFPELSGIMLSMFDEQGRPQNGFLQLYEIYNLKLSADLVVLSACQTGLGKEIKGEGIVGLTRAFMYAGVPRVVASLWRVNDVATAALMSRFYREMIVNGLKPAAALRAAQLDLSWEKRYQHPYFWAGFVLQGEWN